MGEAPQHPLPQGFHQPLERQKEATVASDSTPTPPADPTLAALAVLTSFTEKNIEDVDKLLDVIAERELTMGLLEVSSYLATILGNATGTTPTEVLTHLRETVLQMVTAGQLGAEALQIPLPGGDVS